MFLLFCVRSVKLAFVRGWIIFQGRDDDTGQRQRCETAEQKEAEEGKCVEIWGTQGSRCHGLCPYVRSEYCILIRTFLHFEMNDLCSSCHMTTEMLWQVTLSCLNKISSPVSSCRSWVLSQRRSSRRSREPSISFPWAKVFPGASRRPGTTSTISGRPSLSPD